MKISVEKRVINAKDFKYRNYFELGYSYCCDGMDYMYNNGFLSLVDGNTESNLINFKEDCNEDNNVFIGMVNKYMEDYGDYNYDDEYEPNYVEEVSFLKINNCPMCGKKIEINIKENDVTREYENIKMKYPKNKKTKADKELRKKLDEEISVLVGSYIG